MTEIAIQAKLTQAIIADTPSWAGRTLKAWDETGFSELVQFAAEKYLSGQHSINVFEVVGTTNPEYHGMSWLRLLGKRPRHMNQNNLLLQEQSQDYYLADEIKRPSMSYIEVDGSGWYVNDDGDHRTCIARFMLHEMGRTMLHGVNVESYRTDHRAFASFQRLRDAAELKRLPLTIEPHRKTLSRDDTAGWMRERYEVKIRVINLQKGTDELLTPDEADAYAASVMRPRGIEWLFDRLSAKQSFFQKKSIEISMKRARLDVKEEAIHQKSKEKLIDILEKTIRALEETCVGQEKIIGCYELESVRTTNELAKVQGKYQELKGRCENLKVKHAEWRRHMIIEKTNETASFILVKACEEASSILEKASEKVVSQTGQAAPEQVVGEEATAKVAEDANAIA